MDKKYNGFNNGRDRSDGVGGREVNHGKQETMTKEIKELVLNEYKNGNIVVAGIEGLQTMPIKEFIKQDAEFMLYDLNRSEAVVLTFINDPKWVNDYAVCKVIRELKQQLSAERERLEGLIKNEPVSFFLVNIMRSLPNEKWPDLINSLNERCSLPTAERERAGKLVEALQKLAWHLDRLKQYDIVELIKQTLNDYEKS